LLEARALLRLQIEHVRPFACNTRTHIEDCLSREFIPSFFMCERNKNSLDGNKRQRFTVSTNETRPRSGAGNLNRTTNRRRSEN
jgi:hypothetical protein